MAKFIITPLYEGVPQVNDQYEIETDDEQYIAELRTGWTNDSDGTPVRLPYMADEIE